MSRREGHDDGDGASGRRRSGAVAVWIILASAGLVSGCESDLSCDSGAAGRACSAGLGACEASGVLVCENDVLVCNAIAGLPRVEACDNQDNDCDGRTDEALFQDCYSGLAELAGVGVCTLGTQACRGGRWGVCQEQGEPECADAEGCDRCNGSDEDCDGRTDEDQQAESCYGGPDGTQDVGTCRAGTQRCVNGALGACEGEVVPEVVDRCDGQDEDCDGGIDEDEFMVECYSGPAGTEDVGICRGGTRTCVDGALGACEGEVPPEAADVCDGRDEDCDGGTDIGPGGEPLCGDLVARHCRFWLGWSSDDTLDPMSLPEGYDAVLTTWGDCHQLAEFDQDGDTRCTNSGVDRGFHPMELPSGLLVAATDSFGIRFYCDLPVGAPEAVIRRLQQIRTRCGVSLGTAGLDQGSDAARQWGVCADGQGAGVTEDRLLHCNSTRGEDGGWFPVSVGRTLGPRSDLGLAFRCVDDDLGRSVQSQTAAWIAWAAWSAEGPPDETWGGCGEAENPSEGPVRCVSSAGDGRYHRLDIGASVGPGQQLHAGWLGVALTPIEGAAR